MADFFIIRQTAAQWTASNATLLANQIGIESNIVNGVETDTLKAKLGNGLDGWNTLGYWSPSGGGAGTVTSVSVTTANGVSGSVATATTTPAITLTLGAIVPTTVNKVTITAPATSATLTVADGKTLTASNSITLAGTDSTTMTFPPASANIGYLESPINSQANDYTGVLSDSGKTILITGASKTFTIPPNGGGGAVAYPVGTCLSGIFTNATGGSVAITTDTMTLAGTTTTGTRTVTQNGRWTAQKMTSTTWLISGVGIA